LIAPASLEAGMHAEKIPTKKCFTETLSDPLSYNYDKQNIYILVSLLSYKLCEGKKTAEKWSQR
jgi:hypothetical protein